MRTITVKLPEHLDAALEATAASRRVSKSAVVRDALQRALPGTAPAVRQRRASLHDRLAKYQVAGRTGVRDLASNPEHLVDYGC